MNNAHFEDILNGHNDDEQEEEYMLEAGKDYDLLAYLENGLLDAEEFFHMLSFFSDLRPCPLVEKKCEQCSEICARSQTFLQKQKLAVSLLKQAQICFESLKQKRISQ